METAEIEIYKWSQKERDYTPVTRTVNLSIGDIRDFKGRAGFIWLVMAANPHLSIAEIKQFAEEIGKQHERGPSWISSRRKLFHGMLPSGAKADLDGKGKRARAIMAANPTLSLRKLRKALAQAGIDRGLDWIRWARVPDCLLTSDR